MSTQNMSVLICEDDPDMSMIIKLALEQAGLETTIVATLQEAAQKLKHISFAAMTLDLNLPDGNGLEFLRELRTQWATSPMPVIVVSAAATEARRTFPDNAALLDWLARPLDRQALVQSIQSALRRGESLLRLLYVGNSSAANKLAHLLAGDAQLVVANDLADFYCQIRARSFDLLILDPALAKTACKEVLDHVNAVPRTCLAFLWYRSPKSDLSVMEKRRPPMCCIIYGRWRVPGRPGITGKPSKQRIHQR